MAGIIRDPASGQLQFIGRYIKPGFQYQSTKSIVLTADTNRPAFFVIGGAAYEVTTNLECSLLASNFGGVCDGTTISASTVYYLYGVISNGQVGLTIDIADPANKGPKTFSDWTYLGGFVTNSSSAVPQFVSSEGRFQKDGFVDVTTASATLVAKALLVPIPAKVAIGQLGLGISGVAGNVAISPTSSAIAGVTHEVGSTTGTWFTYAECQLLETQTIYMSVSDVSITGHFKYYGWIEDPSEYQ